MRPPRGHRAKVGRSYAGIERIAFEARRWVVGDAKLPLPGVDFFESLDGEKVETSKGTFSLTVGVKDLSSADGLVLFDSEEKRYLLMLSEKTYGGLEEGDPRSRFSLAHEIGHLVLHREELLEMSRIPHHEAALMRASHSHRPFEDTEWQADAFAAALLMPASGLHALEREGGLTAEALQERYLVSSLAAEIRLDVFLKRRTALLQKN